MTDVRCVAPCATQSSAVLSGSFCSVCCCVLVADVSQRPSGQDRVSSASETEQQRAAACGSWLISCTLAVASSTFNSRSAQQQAAAERLDSLYPRSV